MRDGRRIRAGLAALGALAERLDCEPAEAFGRWVPSAEIEPGVLSMPWVEYGPLEADLRVAAAPFVRPDIDWMRWLETEDAQALRRDPARLARATPEELAHLLTAIVRSERFGDGNILGAFESGLLARIARRAAVLASASPDDSGRDPPSPAAT